MFTNNANEQNIFFPNQLNQMETGEYCLLLSNHKVNEGLMYLFQQIWPLFYLLVATVEL